MLPRNPPFLENNLLIDPWGTIFVLVVIGIVLFIVGRQRANGRFLLASVAMVVLAAAVYVTAALVVTPREQVAALTRRLVHSAVRARQAQLMNLLAADADVQGPNGEVWLTHGQLQATLHRAFQHFGVKEQTVLSLSSDVPQRDLAVALVNVRTVMDTQLGEQPIVTQWLITWTRPATNQPWRVQHARWLRFMGSTPTRQTLP